MTRAAIAPFWLGIVCGLLGCGAARNASAPTQREAATRDDQKQARSPTTRQKDKAMLRGQPFLQASITAQNIAYQVYVNGGFVSTDMSGLASSEQWPINQLARSGRNQISVVVYPWEQEDGTHAFSPSSKFELKITAREAQRAEAPEYELMSIRFDGERPSLDATTGSSAQGTLDSERDFARADQGDVGVGALIVEKVEDSGTLHIWRDLDVQLPFPEWEFLRSDREKPTYAMSEAEILPKYNELLNAYDQIWSLLASRRVDQLMPMFEERSRELDRALYQPAGTTQAKLRRAFESALSDPDCTLQPVRPEQQYWRYDVGPGGTQMRLAFGERQGAIIRFLLHAEEYSRAFPVVFRRKGGKYIVSR